MIRAGPEGPVRTAEDEHNVGEGLKIIRACWRSS
jgi:hypothetical protein